MSNSQTLDMEFIQTLKGFIPEVEETGKSVMAGMANTNELANESGAPNFIESTTNGVAATEELNKAGAEVVECIEAVVKDYERIFSAVGAM